MMWAKLSTKIALNRKVTLYLCKRKGALSENISVYQKKKDIYTHPALKFDLFNSEADQ